MSEGHCKHESQCRCVSEVTLCPAWITPDRFIEFNSLAEALAARKLELEGAVQPPLSYYSNEMGGECGEAQNVVKKLERERYGMPGSRATIAQLAEELADVVMCAYLVARETGIDLDAAIPPKFNATTEKNGGRVLMALKGK